MKEINVCKHPVTNRSFYWANISLIVKTKPLIWHDGFQFSSLNLWYGDVAHKLKRVRNIYIIFSSKSVSADQITKYSNYICLSTYLQNIISLYYFWTNSNI